MIIIAHRSAGNAPDYHASSFLLVKTRHALQSADSRAQVLDMEEKVLHPWFNVNSILALGYWEEYNRPQHILPCLLEQVECRSPFPARDRS